MADPFYVEVWRGLPILVTVLFIWLPAYDSAPFHIQLNAYMSAALALSLWGSAQVAEATRGALQSIPKEQHEAAAALGFGWVPGRKPSSSSRRPCGPACRRWSAWSCDIIQNTTMTFVISINEFLQSGNRQVET